MMAVFINSHLHSLKTQHKACWGAIKVRNVTITYPHYSSPTIPWQQITYLFKLHFPTGGWLLLVNLLVEATNVILTSSCLTLILTSIHYTSLTDIPGTCLQNNWQCVSSSSYQNILSDSSESETICLAIHQRWDDSSGHYPLTPSWDSDH